MKKPIFADIAELVGGLLAAEKKKKKRRTAGTTSPSTTSSYAASKYDVIDVPALVRALPARPARLPVVLVPGAPRAAPAVPAAPGRRKRTHLEVVRDLAQAKLAAVNVAQAKRRQAAADLLEAESAYYDPNKKRLTPAKIRSVDSAFKAAQENDAKRAEAVGTALAASEAAKAVYETEQARLGIARVDESKGDESKGDDESVEVFVDALPAKKGKRSKKSVDKAFSEYARAKTDREEARAEERTAKSDARLEALRLKTAAADTAKASKAEAKAAKAEAKAAKAAPPLPKGFETLQKLAKAQTAARKEAEKGREKLVGLPVPEAVPLTGLGRFLGRFA